jgi:hypothetical protein
MGSEVGGLGLIPPGNEHSVRLVHRGESVQTGSNVSPQNEASEHRPARPEVGPGAPCRCVRLSRCYWAPGTCAGDSGPR